MKGRVTTLRAVSLRSDGERATWTLPEATHRRASSFPKRSEAQTRPVWAQQATSQPATWQMEWFPALSRSLPEQRGFHAVQGYSSSRADETCAGREPACFDAVIRRVISPGCFKTQQQAEKCGVEVLTALRGEQPDSCVSSRQHPALVSLQSGSGREVEYGCLLRILVLLLLLSISISITDNREWCSPCSLNELSWSALRYAVSYQCTTQAARCLAKRRNRSLYRNAAN